ncbi:hypothetical protein K438DRAFT_1981653 [Mycena galopus ATCC 62051]|nr:hypothetical protein K438DRAFT_1981653 [Mycena galopus ATCC 62051]
MRLRRFCFVHAVETVTFRFWIQSSYVHRRRRAWILALWFTPRPSFFPFRFLFGFLQRPCNSTILFVFIVAITTSTSTLASAAWLARHRLCPRSADASAPWDAGRARRMLLPPVVSILKACRAARREDEDGCDWEHGLPPSPANASTATPSSYRCVRRRRGPPSSARGRADGVPRVANTSPVLARDNAFGRSRAVRAHKDDAADLDSTAAILALPRIPAAGSYEIDDSSPLRMYTTSITKSTLVPLHLPLRTNIHLRSRRLRLRSRLRTHHPSSSCAANTYTPYSKQRRHRAPPRVRAVVQYKYELVDAVIAKTTREVTVAWYEGTAGAGVGRDEREENESKSRTPQEHKGGGGEAEQERQEAGNGRERESRGDRGRARDSGRDTGMTSGCCPRARVRAATAAAMPTD